MEVSQNPQSEPLQIQQQAPRTAEQFALERSDSRNESENGKRRRTEDLLERQSRASPQPEVSVDQNLVQYFRGLELVSEKMDNLGYQLTGVEHGMNDLRGNMKILWRKSNEREDAQNILSKSLELEKIHQRAIQTENSRAMEAHTKMLSTLKKRIEDAQHLPLQISGGDSSTSSNLPQIMEGVHAQIAAATLAISKVENDLNAVQTGVMHNQNDWVNNREHLRQQNEQLELLQRELLILQTDYPKTRVNLRQVQTTVSELQKRTTHLDQLNQTYLRGIQEVRGDLDNLAISIDNQLQTNSREEQRALLELKLSMDDHLSTEIGRASCRERV